MVKKIVVLSDVHLECGEKMDPSYKLVKKFIEEQQPDKVVIDGDFLDFSYISSYTKDVPALRENKRLKIDIDLARKELNFFEKNSKEVIYLAGNHEDRLKLLVEKNPTFTEDILTMKSLLGIDYYVETLDQPIEIADGLFCMHGNRYNTHAAASTVKDYMESIVFGHSHRNQSYTIRTMKKNVTGYNIGCLSSRSPKYLKGRHVDWCNGFGLVEYDNKGWNFTSIIMENDGFIYGGKRYFIRRR